MTIKTNTIDRIQAICKNYLDMLSKFDNEEDRKSGLYEKYRLQFDVDCKRDIYNLMTELNPGAPTFEVYMENVKIINAEK